MHCFHIEVPLLGFKSSITHVTLGKVKQGKRSNPDTLYLSELFLQWWKILHELGKSEEKKKKKRRSRNRRKCKLGRLDTGVCAVFIYSFIIWELHKSFVTVEEFTSGRQSCWTFGYPPPRRRRLWSLRFTDSSSSQQQQQQSPCSPNSLAQAPSLRLIHVWIQKQILWLTPSPPLSLSHTHFPMSGLGTDRTDVSYGISHRELKMFHFQAEKK